MRKLLLGALLLLSMLSLSSCQSKFNYECPGLFKSTDWKIVSDLKKTKDTLWGLDKKVKLDENKGTDSTLVSILGIKKVDIKKLPDGNKLKTMINSALIECKYACNNTETFNPKSIMLYTDFGDEKDFYISIRFNCSNSYGVPGSVNGSFTYDKINFKLKDKFIY